MESFSLHQRYASIAEPDLGIGIVTETAKGRVKIHFPTAGETRLYAVDTAPLRRVRFKIGDTIVDRDGRSLQVEHIQEEADLVMYRGQGKTISEAVLGNMSVKHGADDRLLMGDVDTPALFALRRLTLQHAHARQVSSINGFAGGRIDLIPHQLYIAHEVSARYAPRVLLSDEVGLGKTIEACLILHRLRALGRISRVMILVPESLVHQWFVELLRRFNMWFHIFDEARCRSAEKGAPDGNPFLDDQLILCSTAFLAGSPLRTRQAIAANWDMLVVDEAHHLEWSVAHPSPAYGVVEALSKVAKGLLLLTATPEQLGLESHFARLRLLDPDRYADFDAFQQEAIHHRETADIVAKLSQEAILDTADADLLASLVGQARVQALRTGDAGARELLIQDLLDQHGPGRVVFRNRRASMTGFPRRIVHLEPIGLDVEQQASPTTEPSTPAGVAEQTAVDSSIDAFNIECDPRLEWLVARMQKLRPAKVLLICNHKDKVLALEEALRTRVKFKIGVFHEELTLVQRDRNAAWFSEADGARLLICSEIGSEGRNFQFAHHLILFDLPVHPELLEQRIGRLDRIGQTDDIQIHVPYLVGSAQEVLARWYHEGLNAFESNLEGGDQMAQLFGGRLQAIADKIDLPESQKQLEDLIAETAAFHATLKATLAAGRDRLLEMNSFRPAIAAELIDEIRAADLSMDLETYMLAVFEHFGIDVEDLAPRTYLLHAQQGNAAAFPALPDEGMGVTFDRKRALNREEIGFLSWDHPMVTGAIDLVLGSGTGSASFAVLRGAGAPAILLEVLFVLETSGHRGSGVDRFLPSTPLRVVMDHRGTDVTAQYPVAALEPQLRAGHIDDLLDNETLMETILPSMLDAATAVATANASAAIAQGLRNMQATMDHEIDRLQALQLKNNHIRPEEIQIAVDERSALAGLIADARIRLDAVQLIQKG